MALKACLGGQYWLAFLLTGCGKTLAHQHSAEQVTTRQLHAAHVIPRANRKPQALAPGEARSNKSDWSALILKKKFQKFIQPPSKFCLPFLNNF